jgi:subtilase family serine protease
MNGTGGYTAAQQSALADNGEKLAPGGVYVLPNNVKRACGISMNPDYAECFALVRTDVVGPDVNGYGPPDLQSAYNLPSATKGSGQTVAIVDAFDQPNIESDLQVYRTNFGLPTCNSSNGCFQKLNQDGLPGPYPPPNTGWGQEISLDVDMVSASCPNCNIILIEATDNSFKNLGIAVKRAVKLKADVVSNSYGAAGNYKAWGIMKAYTYRHPVIMASSGDSGYGPSVPAGFPTVVSVGGTSLRRITSGRGWQETVWNGTNSGCSTKQMKPTWQTDKVCKGKTQNDVSAVSNPGTGVAFYDTYGGPGWGVIGGTSVASPLLAGIYGLAENGSKIDNAASHFWAQGASLYDVVSGSNGICTPPDKRAYWCTGEVGYDGPTGNGTPNGTGAF